MKKIFLMTLLAFGAVSVSFGEDLEKCKANCQKKHKDSLELAAGCLAQCMEEPSTTDFNGKRLLDGTPNQELK